MLGESRAGRSRRAHWNRSRRLHTTGKRIGADEEELQHALHQPPIFGRAHSRSRMPRRLRFEAAPGGCMSSLAELSGLCKPLPRYCRQPTCQGAKCPSPQPPFRRRKGGSARVISQINRDQPSRDRKGAVTLRDPAFAGIRSLTVAARLTRPAALLKRYTRDEIG